MYFFVYLTSVAPLLAFSVLGVVPSTPMLAFACAVGGLWGAGALSFIVCKPQDYYSVCGTLGCVTAIHYLLGAAVSLAMWGERAVGVYDYLSTGTVPPVAAAGIYVLAFSLALIAVGKYEHEYWRPTLAAIRNDFKLGWIGVGLIAICGAFQVAGIANGERGFSSVVILDDGDKVPVLWGFIAQVAMALPIVLTWAMVVSARQRRWAQFAILAGVACVNLMWFAMQSRVVFAVSIMLAILSYTWSSSARVSLARVAAITTMAIPLVVGAWLLSSSVRMLAYDQNAFAYNEHSYRVQTDVGKDVREGLSLLQNGGDWVADYLVQNVALRSFYIGYLRTLMASREPDPYLYGSETGTAIAMGIPRAIFPWKRDLLGDSFYTTEWRLNRSFGFEVADMPDTIVTSAYGNFGIAGLVIYPPLLAGFAILLAGLARLAPYPILKLYIFGLAFTLAVIIEVSLTSWVIVLRTCLFLAVAAAIYAFPASGAEPRVRAEAGSNSA